eukprot:TRINITY_DN18034_c0_g1_i1.p1 TRINITY_DN18034_c0_g1~~TRINITY_DN18034_c0_g1_i1.p1  ORF type:complete len:357 (-),score=48.69 TRINITY_DN18034_c0_g1_i1:51-1040(-)
MSQSFSISVAASTSNLGPGFDVIGMSLNLYLVVDVFFGKNKAIVINHSGEGEGKVPLDGTNLIVSSANFLSNKVGKPLPTNMNINVHNSIPLGGGLGSSGAAIVAGVILANHILDLQLSREALLSVCVEIEGHPDNVTPALVGGCVACCGKEIIDQPTEMRLFPPRSYYLPIPFDSRVRCVAVTPAFHLSTAKARAVLPDKYTKKDVIFNLQRVAILVAGLGSSSKNKEVLHEALKDTIHHPYRAKLIPGLEKILTLNKDVDLLNNGLIGITLSGSGPTILALTDSDDERSHYIGSKIQQVFEQHDLKSTVRLLCIDTDGAKISLKSRL